MYRLLYNFIFFNRYKKITILATFYSLVYRVKIILIPMNKLKQQFGILNAESKIDDSVDNYIYAMKVGNVVSRVSKRTPWETKCLVQALTAQKILKRRGIKTTLYLGVKKETNDSLCAHAWLRCGKCQITGGDGSGYVMLAKFCSK